MGASSHTIRVVCSINCANLWVVLPPGNNNDAIPDDATTRTIFPSERILLIIVFHKNVFSVPPWPYTKNIPPSPVLTVSRILA
ncbi:hypothetical protein IHE45_06G038800 [Dioscorea alata]|uniref:Uncharacterized protein n=1 Tax=Dioscorea alata TaxID=55571 RepID=A0ACB7VWD8_DIOAL|nr:hypothetical protein IHE45_06G038800 [Dioscorea alata]